jgi:hypothetical protein
VGVYYIKENMFALLGEAVSCSWWRIPILPGPLLEVNSLYAPCSPLTLHPRRPIEHLFTYRRHLHASFSCQAHVCHNICLNYIPQYLSQLCSAKFVSSISCRISFAVYASTVHLYKCRHICLSRMAADLPGHETSQA